MLGWSAAVGSGPRFARTVAAEDAHWGSGSHHGEVTTPCHATQSCDQLAKASCPAKCWQLCPSGHGLRRDAQPCTWQFQPGSGAAKAVRIASGHVGPVSNSAYRASRLWRWEEQASTSRWSTPKNPISSHARALVTPRICAIAPPGTSAAEISV